MTFIVEIVAIITHKQHLTKRINRMVEGIIKGELASKSNQRRLVVIRGQARFVKSAKALAFVEDALWQLKGLVKSPIEGDVILEATIYYASFRPDLDESLLMDVLQEAGVYNNDRQIKEKHIYHGVDKKNPRVEFKIWPRKTFASTVVVKGIPSLSVTPDQKIET